MSTAPLLAALVGLVLAAQPALADDAAQSASRVATEYVEAYYNEFPEEAFEVGFPRAPADRLADRSLAATAAWVAREDGWIAALKGLDTGAIKGTPAAIARDFALDRLEAARARRVCRMELWRVSPTGSGWQQMLTSTFAQQPVATEADRAAALRRARAVPRYLDTEMANLRAGIDSGYLAAQSSVDAVLLQIDGLLEGTPGDSPFFDPARRSGDAAFSAALGEVVAGQIQPALRRYREYLETEYRQHARAAVGVAANPQGEACYRASVRFHTSLELSPQAIHDAGLEEMRHIEAEMREISRRSFGTTDLKEVLERLRSDPAQMYRSEQELLEHARSAVERARAVVPEWFGYVPDARIVVQPYPAYMKASGGAYYSVGSEDGTRPGTYEMGTWQPQHIPRAGTESTAFHEGWPGHHLQMSIALYGKGVHPVLRYIYVSGMAEGWGLYAERLAEEMGLYSGDADRLGMLSNQALRAARLVVDSGMHALGWSREQAIAYMLGHTAESEPAIVSEVDRYIAWPGQATAYLTGSREIFRLRREAERKLGRAFDIRAFHDRVLGDGAVSLPMLAASIGEWVEERSAQSVDAPAPPARTPGATGR